MPVNYGVLRGKITDAIPYNSGTDHYQIIVQADQPYRIAVDVYSKFAGQSIAYAPDGNTVLDTDRMVMYYKDENYKHPVINSILKCKQGFTLKAAMLPSICLDYVHFNPPLFPLNLMKVVKPKSDNSAGENLNGDIDPWVQQAKNNPNAEVFAFGSGWNDALAGSRPDNRFYFSPNPSVGVHDIHMNQGDTGNEKKNNGSKQDGALFIYFKNTNKWVAMFFRFQNQSIHTDANGNPV
ncbi:DUF2278 family protein [Mucilaginibacter arboris]|uniref:DUF2278 family protein n=1 Tax=Mucilaginibacter arboris TaxID=2682090 RepID=A0A7K1SYT7_9SPHI|nr:DUF2278 family protein [Mucilaginibacter arboris]MVN22428.1 DUF2278 family protein [Mucilaginibacter arboris]